MNLKKTEKTVKILILAVLLLVLLCAIVPASFQKYIFILIVLLLFSMSCIILMFSKCPYCKGHIHIFGMTHCPSCGKKLPL